MCEGRKAQRLRNWNWLSTENQMVCWKKNSSESPGSSYVKGLLYFFLLTCTPFKNSKSAGSGPTSLGRSFSRGVSQPWLTRIWPSFSCAFSVSCYRLLCIHLPVSAGVQFWQHEWDCMIQIPPNHVNSSWEPGLNTTRSHTFPPSPKAPGSVPPSGYLKRTVVLLLSQEVWVMLWQGSVADPLLCTLWFLPDGLGEVSKPQIYPKHHQFLHKCYE